MSNVFTKQTFDPSIIPPHLKPEEKDVIKVAIGVGWTAHIASRNALTIVSPDGNKRHYFGTSSGARRMPADKVLKDVMRRGDPELVETLDSIIGLPKKMQMKALAAAGLPIIGQPGTVVDHTPEVEEARKAKDVSRAARAARAAKAASPVASSNGRKIISTKPMISKAGENKGYESPTTMERTWSDGTRDYACRFSGCNYTAEGRGSVPTHYATTHSRGKGRSPQPEGFEADVSEARRYKPRPARVAALAEALRDLLQNGTDDPEVLAREALVWVHENPRTIGVEEGEEERGPTEPMTPEQTLDRIRTMLDGGALAEARKREAELEERLVAAEQAAEKARGTLRTFLELAQEEAAAS